MLDPGHLEDGHYRNVNFVLKSNESFDGITVDAPSSFCNSLPFSPPYRSDKNKWMGRKELAIVLNP